MEGEATLRAEAESNEARIAAASAQLEDVLETVDFEGDPDLADAVLDAVTATERAYRLETADREQLVASRDRRCVLKHRKPADDIRS